MWLKWPKENTTGGEFVVEVLESANDHCRQGPEEVVREEPAQAGSSTSIQEGEWGGHDRQAHEQYPLEPALGPHGPPEGKDNGTLIQEWGTLYPRGSGICQGGDQGGRELVLKGL